MRKSRTRKKCKSAIKKLTSVFEKPVESLSEIAVWEIQEEEDRRCLDLLCRRVTEMKAKHDVKEGRLLTTKDVEMVDHPAHYGGADNPYEAIKVIEAWGLGFHLGSAVKYISRLNKKAGNSGLQDARKCLWYIKRYVELLEKKNA